MPTITLSVPSDLKAEMDKTKFINWSEVAREAIKNKVVQLALFNSIVKDSKLTEKEANKIAIELGRKIKIGMHKKYKESSSNNWMKLVVDANVIFSSLISQSGKTSKILFSNEFELYSPEYLFEELDKYKKYICKKSGLSLEKIESLISLIFLNIKIIPLSEFEHSLLKAKEICPDPNDEEYFALALSKNIPIWSDDKALKQQSVIEVISTTELINSFS